MKKHFFPALKLTLLMIFLLTIVYPLIVWGIAQTGPNQGKGKIIEYKGNHYYTNIGQSFTDDSYFWSRPSAVNYNAAASGGSNKGPSNEEYLETVKSRIDTFMAHNPGVEKSQIPVDLITASGSGLDPHISVQAARIQVKRIATIKNLNETSIHRLIDQQIEKPLFGIFGPERINVLQLNIALDQLRS